ncbi:MAG TPA: hypothetical protein PLH19_09870 [Anaerolineae bacterium]|nr:hypothetical protein [Anaerolineae bacterium]HQH38824.1 hypothetical protein [Anaerolineae bacterium]
MPGLIIEGELVTNVGDWLLEGEPWVAYRTRMDLLRQAEDDPQVVAARQATLAHPHIQALLAELSAWPGASLKRHNDASHVLHKLVFIADIGLRVDNPGVAAIVERVLAHQSAQGPFQVLTNIPTHFGGRGEDEYNWMLCDAPLILYALVKFGLGDDVRVRTAVAYLADLVRDNGWPCAGAPEIGKFRGPGRASDPCPYANLLMLKLLAELPEWRDSAAAHAGAEAALTLWAQRKERRPYLFAMGTDFAKLKAPLIWYDILHVLDVLSRFPWLRDDPRVQEMATPVVTKADADSRFTPESIWTAWKGWDFGQKRAPSRWMTLLVVRMLERISTTNPHGFSRMVSN